MTQLDYYTSLVKHAIVAVGLLGGLFSLGLFLVGAYYLYPWVKK